MSGITSVESVERRRTWAKRAVGVIATIVFLVVAGLLGAAFLPRWWSHRIGGQVHGSIGLGVALGLFYGFMFTALPIAVLRWAFRERRAVKTWAISFGVAIVFALPNLLTLGIVLGSGNAAHAGDRTLDVEAPAFRSSELAGVILALITFGLVEYLLRSRRHAHREVERLRAELRSRDEQEKARATEPPPTPAPAGHSQ